MTRQITVYSVAGVCLLSAATLFAQPPAVAPQPAAVAQDPAAALLTQGQQKLREGKHEEALALYRAAIEKATPSSAIAVSAYVQAGIVLDLMGRYADARSQFDKAIEGAAALEDKARALRAMSMSYAFERNCDGAARYESQAYQGYLAASDFFNAGEVANELARACLESGSLDQAAAWYQRGRDAGLKEPGMKPERRDLWDFRWEHAQARLAARRGQQAEAQKHVAAARAILDKGTNPEQAPFLPYLVGYVAFYSGDYQGAVTELLKGNQNDPFMTCLIAQAYEKLGDKDKATEFYRKVLASNGHSPTNAYARPLAKEKLGVK
jgi:tetratricopeptide (TPR) repeat protein